MAARRLIAPPFVPLVAMIAAALFLSACAEPTPEGRFRVEIAGETFDLEPALDNATRTRGLGGRESVDPDGGMLFVFPTPQILGFVMRDCLVPIDIAFVGDTGRVIGMHAMPVEEPQRDDESATEYELRLKRYTSRFPCRIAIEVAGGTWARLGLEVGDRVEIEGLSELKRRAR